MATMSSSSSPSSLQNNGRRAGSYQDQDETAGYGLATASSPLDKIDFRLAPMMEATSASATQTLRSASSSSSSVSDPSAAGVSTFGVADSAFSLQDASILDPTATTPPLHSGLSMDSGILSTSANMNPITPSATASATSSSDEGFDVMAQLASQYYSISRNRSYSAPIPPSSLGSTWQFQDDTATGQTAPDSSIIPPPSQPPQPPLPPSVLNIMAPVDSQVVNTAGAIGSGVPSLRGSFIGDLQSLHINTEPENEPIDGTEKHLSAEAEAAAAAIAAGGPLPATFLRTICDQLEFYFCDENLLGDLFLLKNMNMDGYGTCCGFFISGSKSVLSVG